MNTENLHPITRAIIPLVKGMCRFPDEIEFTEEHNGLGLVIFVSPRMEDHPVLCGRRGRQINALKWIVKSAGQRFGAHGANIELVKSFRGEDIPGPDFRPNADFDKQSGFTQIFESLLELVFGTVPRYDRSDDDKIYITIHENPSTVEAIGDVFYPFGFRHGKKVVVSPPKHATSERTHSEKPVRSNPSRLG